MLAGRAALRTKGQFRQSLPKIENATTGSFYDSTFQNMVKRRIKKPGRFVAATKSPPSRLKAPECFVLSWSLAVRPKAGCVAGTGLLVVSGKLIP